MGAETFVQYAGGTDLAAAFDRSVERARHVHGNGGYSGSIAEKSAVLALGTMVRWRSDAEAEADRLLETEDPRIDDKWGPAGALPVALETTTERVALDGAWPLDSDWVAAATAALGRRGRQVVKAEPDTYRTTRPGTAEEMVLRVVLRRPEAGRITRHQVQVTVDGSPNDVGFTDRVAAAARTRLRLPATAVVRRVHVTASDVATRAERSTNTGRSTRYVIRGDGRHDRWETGFGTLGEARARLRALADEPLPWRASEARYGIEAMVRAADGSPLAELVVTARRTRVTVEVEVVRDRRDPTKQDGWLLFGWASA